MSASWRSVILSPLVTPSTYVSMVSSRRMARSSTSWRMSVTVYDFVTLRSGHVMSVPAGTSFSMSASPAAVVQAPSPGTHTPTAAPGTPYSFIVWSSAACSFPRSSCRQLTLRRRRVGSRSERERRWDRSVDAVVQAPTSAAISTVKAIVATGREALTAPFCPSTRVVREPGPTAALADGNCRPRDPSTDTRVSGYGDRAAQRSRGDLMRLRRRFAAVTIALTLALGSVGLSATAEAHRRPPKPKDVQLQVLSFNDFHGHLQPPGGTDATLGTALDPSAHPGRWRGVPRLDAREPPGQGEVLPDRDGRRPDRRQPVPVRAVPRRAGGGVAERDGPRRLQCRQPRVRRGCEGAAADAARRLPSRGRLLRAVGRRRLPRCRLPVAGRQRGPRAHRSDRSSPAPG